MMGPHVARAKADITDTNRAEITQVVRVTGAVGLDLYSEGDEEFHSDVRVFLRHLA